MIIYKILQYLNSFISNFWMQLACKVILYKKKIGIFCISFFLKIRINKLSWHIILLFLWEKKRKKKIWQKLKYIDMYQKCKIIVEYFCASLNYVINYFC